MQNNVNGQFEEFEEAYKIVETALVVHNKQFFKIEVRQDFKKLREFSVCVYVQTPIKAAQPIPANQKTSDVKVWSVAANFPRAAGKTSENAMSKALGFLELFWPSA